MKKLHFAATLVAAIFIFISGCSSQLETSTSTPKEEEWSICSSKPVKADSVEAQHEKTRFFVTLCLDQTTVKAKVQEIGGASQKSGTVLMIVGDMSGQEKRLFRACPLQQAVTNCVGQLPSEENGRTEKIFLSILMGTSSDFKGVEHLEEYCEEVCSPILRKGQVLGLSMPVLIN